MQTNYLKKLRGVLNNCIDELDQTRNLYVFNPERDFTRNRKISFKDVFRLMITIQSKTMPNEIIDYFGHTSDSPTKSAFIQQRSKIIPEAWENLFRSFVEDSHSLSGKTLYGYHIFACDGSDINISRNPEDEESFISEGERGYNAIHLNALYDLLNHTYKDM